MTDLALDDPCVLFALARESAWFRREFRPNQRFPGAPCRARFCAPPTLPALSVLVMECGVGVGRASAAVDWLLSGPKLGNLVYRPRLVIAAGYAGATSPARRVGDVVLATEVVDTQGGRWPTTWPPELGGRWEPPLHRGAVVTVPALVGDPAEKRRLGEESGAVAADMESAAVARACAARGVPFACVRVISDDVDTPLSPRLVSLLSGGRVAPLRVLGAVARAPSLVGELWRLGRDTRRANERLALALGELLTLTLPGG